MKQDRFLLAILAGIGVLAIISLALFFSRQQVAAYGPEDSPQGVILNYTLALQKNDFRKAYSYLAAGQDMPDYARFQIAFNNGQIDSTGTSLEVGEAFIEDNRATVQVTTVRSTGDLFSSLMRDAASAVLVNQNGAWKISSMPYPFWSYDWYQPMPTEKIPPLPASP